MMCECGHTEKLHNADGMCLGHICGCKEWRPVKLIVPDETLTAAQEWGTVAEVHIYEVKTS
jgi:hypothetical protein